MGGKNKSSYVFILSYMIILALGSLTPIPIKAGFLSGGDKIFHFIMYIPLGFLLSLPKLFSVFFLKITIPLSIGSSYGALMELLQNFVSGRTASWYDVIANILGIVVGIGLGQIRGWFSRGG